METKTLARTDSSKGRVASIRRVSEKNLSRNPVFIHPHAFTVSGRMGAARLFSELPRRVLLGNSELPMYGILGNLAFPALDVALILLPTVNHP